LRRGLLPLALAVGLAALAPPALGAPRDADAAVEAAAKARYAEGFRLYNKKKYEEARAAFMQAAALRRRPAAILMVAQSSLRAGRWLEAAHQFDAYVAEQGEVPAKLKELVESGRREARTHLGRIHFEVPEGAEVSLDGDHIASLETPIDVMPGPHTVVTTHLNDKKTETVDAPEGTTIEVKPTFAPKPLVPTSDARTRPKLAPSPPETSPSAAPAESASILSPPATTWPLYVSGAVGLGGLATAAIFGGLAANAQHAVDVSFETLARNGKAGICAPGTTDKDRPQYDATCSTIARNQQLVSVNQGAFTGALIVGVSATAVAALWFVFAPKATGEKAPSSETGQGSSARLVPRVSGTSSGGAAVVGGF
jgi:hypothetical protein